jgi:bifunctional non-homologous end joining protein LigD
MVKLTHADRLYWPDDGVTKAGLADYYTEVWRHIAPFIVGRPLALLRCPSGITGEKFFQKHTWKGLSKAIVQVPDPAAPGEGPLIAINDLDGLLGLVQAAVLEIHPWGATLRDWERPDTITLDLDPGEGVAWQKVIDAAHEVKERLAPAGLAAFVKTTGGKGLHVVAPLKPGADWTAVKAFCKGVADAMAADSPDRYVATITKAKRTGKILVDYLRNQRGATAVAPYSTRARPGAAVSMPLAWDELSSAIGPAYFTVMTAPTRLATLGADPWGDFRAAARPLPVRG